MINSRVQIQLSCGCRPWFRYSIPEMNDIVSCTIHKGKITRVASVDWHLRCTVCRYGRKNLGNAMITAETAAFAHARKAKHPVKIWCQTGDKIGRERVIGSESPGQLELCDPPPF